MEYTLSVKYIRSMHTAVWRWRIVHNLCAIYVSDLTNIEECTMLGEMAYIHACRHSHEDWH